MKRVYITANFPLPQAYIDEMGNCQKNKCAEKIEFSRENTGIFDAICALNTTSKLELIKCRSKTYIKIVMEPPVKRSIFHGFVTKHSPMFTQVLGHGVAVESAAAKKAIITAATAPPSVGSDFSGIKTQLVSAVSSTLDYLPGHKERNRFIDLIVRRYPFMNEHVFGRGRREIENKEQGLDRYMYSFAIENSVCPGYISEKFIDCILRETVPIYWGAPDVGKFFPEKSFLGLKYLNEMELDRVMEKVSRDDYLNRIGFLREAKKQYLDEMQICCRISSVVADQKSGRIRPVLLAPSFGEFAKNILSSRILSGLRNYVRIYVGR